MRKPGRTENADGSGAQPLRILIVCENASANFGGEAAIPLHYFRVFRKLGIPVWLITHARTRLELEALFPGDNAIRYVEDTLLDRAMWRLGSRLPPRLSNFTFGFVSRIATQIRQRRLARRVIAEASIDVVHQPTPVSPREPSMLFGLGVPVVIGPMNGGMDFPKGFGLGGGLAEEAVMRVGRASAALLNLLIPGKRRASLLLVANERTRRALPRGVCSNVAELVENGVDLELWRPSVAASASGPRGGVTTFIYVGRLVDLKGVDLLIRAFARASAQAPMALVIVGDGEERYKLEMLADSLNLRREAAQTGSGVTFTGWLSQRECAERIKAADCLVLPSLKECGGAVILEAMSMGKPVIATDWGGPADYIDDSCGILVAPRSKEDFTSGLGNALVRLARSPSERAGLGQSGLLKIRREYDWDRKVERILDFYALARKTGAS